ncbi:MAG: DUF374 domain-containing protein [Pedosphaera sp.]|nr:DUF374 domain-containing protein [Pedosphaera sp.]
MAAADSRPVVVPRRLRWHQTLLAALIYYLIRVVGSTLRREWRDRSGLLAGTTQPVIFCVWHNRLALSLLIQRDYVQKLQPTRRLAAIVSASGDGAMVARVLEHFDALPVRGSSSRRGPQALLELTRVAAQGRDLAITPDGPRGPRYVVQEGVIAIAQLTGMPIVPVSYHLNWKFRTKSWDGFQIPFPFARWTVTFGEPVRVPRAATGAEREQARCDLETRLKNLTVD